MKASGAGWVQETEATSCIGQSASFYLLIYEMWTSVENTSEITFIWLSFRTMLCDLLDELDENK